MTPLNRVLGLGSAKGGAEHWWMQRLTAVALLPLGLWFAISLLLLDDFAYGAVVDWVQRPLTSVMLVLTVLAVSYHSYLGVQVVIEDYVHTATLKVAALIGSAFAHFGLAVATLFAILKIAFDSV
ncbi:MAG TPA: succinate dehydrogenase, hydrophobic membrane anchor protein [Gammaproteobacteria bacterium]|nr:succinate dehydrogenase, hydrophobic membrane anchor protein [Gammaproteobacteria bacterium]